MPDVSIIIPTYNRRALLQQCLESIIASESFRAEIIVIDDGSSDGTDAMILDVSTRTCGHAIRWIKNPYNLGAQISRNIGLSIATANFVQFVDSDDLIAPAGIASALVELRANPKLSFVHGQVRLVDENLDILPSGPVGKAYQRKPGSLGDYSWQTMGAVYVRAFILDEVGSWNERLLGSQDWDFQARVKISAKRHLFLEEIFGFWRQHSGDRIGVRTFSPKYSLSVIYACRDIFNAAQENDFVDRKLRSRLARRLLLHAFQFGAFELHREKRYALSLVKRIANPSLESVLALGARRTLPAFDHHLLRLISPSMIE